jgi:hypothetical protein
MPSSVRGRWRSSEVIQKAGSRRGLAEAALRRVAIDDAAQFQGVQGRPKNRK